MTITLLDLYNATASQEWAMYDNDALSDAEFEDSLVLALNKAILDIYASYDFPFRERTHLILTFPKMDAYDLPSGLIKRDGKGRHLVKYNSKILNHIENSSELEMKLGVPEGFYIQNDKIVLYPVPIEKGMVTIDYMTLTIGETQSGEEIYSLKNDTDILSVPVHLEELMKEAIITRTMLKTIASETDENYSAYLKQADRAYKLLVKYAKGVRLDKSVKI
ncbi:MAG: hypothetical protein E7Z92_04425 [Cyanobacteria bacterium SIG31]|nr:hypothetical protein [Cyanobacteria bacterium SIG31]